ncbi:MAG: MipA/OmpV family protein [Candidatus Thiodiazotropha sp. (ex Ctena orbiculata)]|nr:MipA/OmpV family protein [Candidatus Thiodiazotropha taylori]
MLQSPKMHLALMGLVSLSMSDSLAAEQRVEFGVVASANSSFYEDAGQDYYLLPLLLADYDRFYLQGINAGYRFFQGETQNLAVEVRRTFDGYESGDSDALEGMKDRDQAWEAGLVYEVNLLGGQAKAKLMHDISNTHDGFTGRVEYERSLLNGKTYMVNWFGGSEFWSRKKTNYYFGVTPEESTSSRPVYTADESYSLFAGVNAVKRLNDRYSLIASADYQWMTDEIDDSPLTTRQDQWTLYAGIFYQF